MKSKFEIGYIVKIKPIFDQSIYSEKGVIANKRFIGPDCIYYVVNVFDDASEPDSYGRQEARTFFEHELIETKAT